MVDEEFSLSLIYIHTHISKLLGVHPCLYVYSYIYTYIYIYIHMYIYIYIQYI